MAKTKPQKTPPTRITPKQKLAELASQRQYIRIIPASEEDLSVARQMAALGVYAAKAKAAYLKAMRWKAAHPGEPEPMEAWQHVPPSLYWAAQHAAAWQHLAWLQHHPEWPIYWDARAGIEAWCAAQIDLHPVDGTMATQIWYHQFCKPPQELRLL